MNEANSPSKQESLGRLSYLVQNWRDASVAPFFYHLGYQDTGLLVAEIERLNRFADFLCRQDWTSRGRAIAEEAFMNAIAMDKEAGFPQPESRGG